MNTKTLVRRIEAASGTVYTAYTHRILLENGEFETCGIEIASAEARCRLDDITADRAVIVRFLEQLCACEALPSELYDLTEDFLAAVS